MKYTRNFWTRPENNPAPLEAMMKEPPIDQKTYQSIANKRVASRRRAEDISLARKMQKDIDG